MMIGRQTRGTKIAGKIVANFFVLEPSFDVAVAIALMLGSEIVKESEVLEIRDDEVECVRVDEEVF